MREPRSAAQFEVDACMNAAVAEMAVERGTVAVALYEAPRTRADSPQAQRIHRSVFPANDGINALSTKVEGRRRGAGFREWSRDGS